GIFGDGAGAVLTDTAKQDPLRIVSERFTGGTSNPSCRWFVERLTGPPIGIPPCRVHRTLRTAADGLADLVGSHEQPLAVGCAGGVKGKLLGVGLVVAKSVFS